MSLDISDIDTTCPTRTSVRPCALRIINNGSSFQLTNLSVSHTHKQLQENINHGQIQFMQRSCVFFSDDHVHVPYILSVYNQTYDLCKPKQKYKETCVLSSFKNVTSLSLLQYQCTSSEGLTVIVEGKKYRCYRPNQLLNIKVISAGWLHHGSIVCPSCQELCSVSYGDGFKLTIVISLFPPSQLIIEN